MRKVFLVIDEDEVVVVIFGSRTAAKDFIKRHNKDRDPRTMEYFLRVRNVEPRR